MQPLIPYLLGEPHPGGKRLVNVQNSFRAQDIDEVGDNRHTTFFRMLGNWSLGDYFKREEIPWLWEFLTVELGLPENKLYITVFEGFEGVPRDNESFEIWKTLVSEEKISFAGVDKNWWSRSGPPANMPPSEIGGPDTEVYYRFDVGEHGKECKDSPAECECGKFLEIANSVFIQYQKQDDGSFKELPQKNVDFGAGVERLLAAVEDKPDMFGTSLFTPVISAIEQASSSSYKDDKESIRIIVDHLTAASFIASEKVYPSNKEQGYILRRLIRRGADHLDKLGAKDPSPVIEAIASEYGKTDSELKGNFETIKNIILEEIQTYKKVLVGGKQFIEKELGKQGTKTGDELKGTTHISADLAFKSLASYGLGPTQLKSLGYDFNEQELSEKMKEHQKVSKAGATKKFAGGLADTSEATVRGHTATHLLHQAIRDLLGTQVHQTGSNITSERVRFDFNYDKALTDAEIDKLENVVNGRIKENLPVHFEMLPLQKAKEIGAIGLFDEKYQDSVKVYFIGPKSGSIDHSPHVHMQAYSREFCGGPHVSFTSEVKSFKIIKQENLGRGQKRLYAKAG